MCGFAGIWTERPPPGGLEDAVRGMTATLAHRGPDDVGHWVDGEHGVGFGFRRLSIIDLSELGHQPMRSAGGRYTILFNGEIYNHEDLRAELVSAGCSFRGHSDTEVICAAFEAWGVRRSIERFNGMFALAIWDAERRALLLARDRLGIKPLYYRESPGGMAFGSELKAIMADPGFDGEIDPESVRAYLSFLYVPAPRSIFRSVKKVGCGQIVEFTTPTRPGEPDHYWSIEAAAERGRATPFGGDEAEAVDALEELLTDSVSRRLRADVPVGALLSGGVDSSAVVSLMRRAGDADVRTFSIGFDDDEHDEADHARTVAEHLGTRHTELYVDGEAAISLVPRLPVLFDEPLADPSQIPTYLVCEMARRDVTVALSGDGGDELFLGYNRYLVGDRLIPRLLRMPSPVRRLAASALSAAPAPVSAAALGLLGGLSRGTDTRLMLEKSAKVRGMLGASSAGDMYRSLMSAWSDPAALVPGAAGQPDRLATAFGRTDLPLLDRMRRFDQAEYLPDDLLAKVDRASMAVSLEVRVPILDHRVVEFSWSLPNDLLSRDGRGKWPLRQVLYRHVPREIVDRPKVGFTVPLAGWLRGPLREWSEDLLHSSLAGDDLIRQAPVLHSWKRLLAGDDAEALRVWTVLTLQMWRGTWMSA